MNEDQRLGRQGNTRDNTNEVQAKAPSKDYSKYFDFSNAKVISEEDNKKVIRISGREISIYDQPDYKQGKRRGKEDVQVLRPDSLIPDDMKGIGHGKKFLIRTYGCQMNTHDSEHMAGLLVEMGFVSTEETTGSGYHSFKYMCDS